MTSATKPAPRVVRSRKPQSQHRRTPIKTLGRGLVAAAAGLIAVSAVMIGAGWLLAAAFQARSDIRSVNAHDTISSRAAFAERFPKAAPVAQSVAAKNFSWPGIEFPSVREIANPVGALAVVIPASAAKVAKLSPDDRIVTGSLNPSAYKLASLGDGLPANAPGVPALPEEARSIPLPRTRPKLASISPIQQLGINPEEEVRPLKTAIYDITAKMVYLPNGERLEAHSGLGEFMDDPRHVHRRMRGATPPNTYKLTFREALFHGVRAIRLTPENERDMFARDGILAHTYMLGPSGQSNGCVSFKDYPKFLRAFQRGEIDRIVVLPRLTRPPTFATQPNARSASAL